MTPPQRRVFLSMVKAGDVAICYASLLVAYLAAHHSAALDFLLVLGTPRPAAIFLGVLGLGFAWKASFERAGLYHSHRMTSTWREALDVLSGCALAAVATMVILLLVHLGGSRYTDLSLLASMWFFVIITPTFLVLRLTRRALVHAIRRKGHNLRQVLIVGTNRRATDLAGELKKNAAWGYHVVGFVDDFWWNSATREEGEHQLLGGLRALPELLRKIPVDEVILTLPIASYYDEVASVIRLCKEHGILLRVAGKLFEESDSDHHLREVGPELTLTLHDRSWGVWGTVMKRCLDLFVSSVLLLLLLPVLAVVTLIIKVTSPGPVLFVQTRLGRGKRPFKIYKFRTMVVDAERLMKSVEHLNETSGPTFKLKNDPRITWIGGFLRKTSLDELPQLLNVFLGDMSLVGPRPLPLRDYEGFSEDWQRRRFSVKPGITCLWQVMGRSSITFDQWMALDLRYIDQWSLWLDIKILAMTIPAVLRGSGAV